jgi:uncharacterized protein YkwD
MKILRLLLVLALFVFIFSCKKDNVPADAGSTGSGGSIVYNVNKSTLLQLVNNVRKSGCTCGSTIMPAVAAVAWNDLLAKAAYDHSNDMKTNNYFSHTGLDGTTPGDRITAAGYNWQAYGENIAMGYPDEQAVMNGWLNSEGHCKNIMDGNFKEMGAGKESSYWTQVFGSK